MFRSVTALLATSCLLSAIMTVFVSASSSNSTSSGVPRAANFNGHKAIRSTRSSRVPLAHPACHTVEKWTVLDKAVDVFGNAVRVLHRFSQDNTLVEQNFFERYCEQDDGSLNFKEETKTLVVDDPAGKMSGVGKCYGVDDQRHHGYCLTRWTYSYAKVLNQSGTVGWTRIRIRAGCECAVFDKGFSEASVLRYLTSS